MTLEEVYILAEQRLNDGQPFTADEISAFAEEIYTTKGIKCRSTQLARREAKRQFIERMTKKHVCKQMS